MYLARDSYSLSAVSRKCQRLPDRDDEDGEHVDPRIPSINLGIPIIIIATKCDRASYLEKQYDFRSEQFDFIQYSLRFGFRTNYRLKSDSCRKFALAHGATLIYTGKV